MTPASVRPLARPGLDTAEALARLRRFGPNRIDDPHRDGLLDTVRGVFAEPMFLLLVVAAGLYLILGDLGEGLLLGFFALVTVGLVLFQERRSARALDELRALAVPQVQVLRDGLVVRIPSTDLVPDDLYRRVAGRDRARRDAAATATPSRGARILRGVAGTPRRSVLAHLEQCEGRRRPRRATTFDAAQRCGGHAVG